MAVPSVETKIFEALLARVESLPMAATHDIAWTSGENALVTGSGADYSPSPSQRYLRVTWTPNQTQRVFIGSDAPHRRPGILQIDVMGTKAQGAGVAREVAGQVAQHFPTDFRMILDDVSVRVMKAPSVLSAFVATHIQVPTIIELEAYA